MERPTIDVRELIDDIRKTGSVTTGAAASGIAVSLPDAASLRASPELGYLNRHWFVDAELVPADVAFAVRLRRALVPRFVRKWIRTWVAEIVCASLERYLLEERVFLENLVRLQNDLARRGDELAEETRLLASITGRVAERIGEISDQSVARDEYFHVRAERRLERLERALRVRA
jgi:hypothetical protein